MAQAEIGALRVRLAMDAGEFSRGITKAQNDIERFSRNLAKVGNRINRTGVILSAALTAPLAAFGAVSLRAAADFERGMSNVSTLIDTNAESLRDMQREVLAIAKRAPVAIADLTSALYDVRSAGIAASDAMAVLEGSARLAVAGLGSTREATDLVTSSINAFGLAGEESQKVYDVIFKTVKAGKTTISQLAQGFGAVAGTVATAGIKLDEYLASVAALTTTGLPAAQAHTQLRTAIAGLTRESEIGRKVLGALGAKDFKGLIEQSGGLVNAFQRIFDALQGNDAQLIKLLGSVEAYNALISLVGKQNGAFTSTLKTMRSGINAVDEAFDKQNGTIAATQQRMTNAIESIGISIGTILTPVVEKIASVLASLADAFAGLSPEMQSTIVIIGGMVAAIGPLVVSLGLLVNGVAALLPVIATVGAAIAGLIAASGPVGLFVIAASAAVTAWNIFRDDIIRIFDKISSYISDKIDAILKRLQEMATTVQAVFGHLSSGDFTSAFDAAFAKTREAVENVTTVAKTVPGLLTAWTTTIETVARDFPPATVPIVTSLEAMTLAQRAHNQALEDGKRIIAEIQTPMEALVAKQWEIKSAFDAGGLSAAQYGRAMAQASALSARTMDALASSVSSNLSAIFGESKTVAIATALINTYQGITQALATYPPPISTAMAAIQAAAGFAQVANIRSQTKSGGGGSGSSSAGASATSGSVAAQAGVQQSLQVQGISSDQLFTGDVVRGLAEQLLDFQRDGGKVVLA